MQKGLLTLLLISLCGGFGTVSAAAETSPKPATPKEIYDKCAEQAPVTGGGVAAGQTYALSINSCLQEEINKQLLISRGQEKANLISKQLDTLLIPMAQFYIKLHHNRYCDNCGTIAASMHVFNLNGFLQNFLAQVTEQPFPPTGTDRYDFAIKMADNQTAQCREQKKNSAQECVANLIQKEINKGFRDNDIKEGQRLFTSIYEEMSQMYNSLYPHNQTKADAALTSQLQEILADLLYLNETTESF